MIGLQRLSLERLSLNEFNGMKEGAEIIEKDHDGDKVLRLKDGSFIKIFRVKSLISQAWFWPYSMQFARNAEKLIARGVQTVDITGCYRLKGWKETAVHYQPLPGKNLRQVFPTLDTHSVKELTGQLASYYADLQQKGIYFRSLHLGNILQLPDKTLGLIDIADMRFSRGPLDTEQRLRNLKHLARYSQDVEYLTQDDTFCSTYAAKTGIEQSRVEQVLQGG
ncbi:toluene tolerance protein [Endozoicomonas sp. OPT23]|uniref:hypothetical protein n=1 Tax=Endozoicomonas sp. OPT23 TaxID=2072845 RepID=UPI001DC89FD5|nr:hypothetical protein [Endozoicomonas sp. OPT23]MRI31956.1 toluene tolerance protein [Endozoicomonas sp. OPT23]